MVHISNKYIQRDLWTDISTEVRRYGTKHKVKLQDHIIETTQLFHQDHIEKKVEVDLCK